MYDDISLLKKLRLNLFKPVTAPNATTQYFMPTDLLKNFIWQHWRDAYTRVGKSQLTKDSNFQAMMTTLRDLEQVTLLDLPWTVGSETTITASALQAKL